MKIIQIMPCFELGGAEIMCENLVYELKKMGHDIIVISLYDIHTVITQRLMEDGIDIRYLNKKSGFDISIYKKLSDIFKREKPDIIHTHLYITKYVFPLIALFKMRGVHTVHTLATKEMAKVSRKFNKFFYKNFKIIPVALSENVKKTIIDEYELEENKVPTVLNGINLKKCNVKEKYETGKIFRVVHVGSFHEVKNHMGLLRAFEIFHEKYPNSELHLIGDGERRHLIEKFVTERKLNENVFFYGNQANVHQYLKDMDTFILASLYEGVPMSIIEAMGTGLPIVATRVGGIPNMLDEKCAILVDIGSDEIAEALEKMYCSTEIRRSLGQNALKRSLLFSSREMAKNYMAIYEYLM